MRVTIADVLQQLAVEGLAPAGSIDSIGLLALMADLRLTWTLGSFGQLGPFAVRGTDLGALAIVALIAYIWRVGLRGRSRGLSEMLEPVGYGAIAALLGVLLFSSLVAVADDVVRGPHSTRANAWLLGPLTTIGIAAALLALELEISREQRAKPRGEAVV